MSGIGLWASGIGKGIVRRQGPAEFASSRDPSTTVELRILRSSTFGFYGTVFKLKEFASNWFAKSFSFDITHGADPVAPVLSRGGALYGVTEQGGIQNGACTLFPTGNGVIFKLGVINNVPKETVLYEGGSDGCGPMGGLVADAAGNLYGTTFQGSANGGTVFEVTP